eukprot:snap_masked-scaffold_4-processed-gene-10.3-mRNA-1 protein AED:1.00 eAED:1.00 QI:0/0/0/0/1/1/2/0/74
MSSKAKNQCRSIIFLCPGTEHRTTKNMSEEEDVCWEALKLVFYRQLTRKTKKELTFNILTDLINKILSKEEGNR